LGGYEERPGEVPPNQSRVNDENVMTIFFVRAQEAGSEIEDGPSPTKTPAD
jgi:hypothetical protein